MSYIVYDGTKINPEQLLSMDEVLEMMRAGGSTDRALTNVRDEYSSKFCDELVWRYPIMVGYALGAVLVPVKEGFLSIAYNTMNPIDYEIYDLNNTCLLTADELQQMIREWNSYSSGLSSALNSMLDNQRRREEN